jgi:phage-related protein
MSSTALPTLTVGYTANSQLNTTFNTLEVRFGDGYAQRAANGINNITHRWQLVWNNLGQTDMTTLQTAVEAVGGAGGLFSWTAPTDTVSRTWSVDNTNGGFQVQPQPGAYIYTATLYLRQEFDT